MGTIVITKSYADTEVLLESDLDNIKDDVESFINGANIADANITAGGVGTASIANASVTSDKINNSAIITTKLNDLAVTTAKIDDLGVTTGKLAAGAVTTAKITDLNVTRPKLVAVGQQVSSSCGSFSGGATSYTDITNLTVTITTTGRPVAVFLQGDGSDHSSIGAGSQEASSYAYVQMLRGATVLTIDFIATSIGVGGGTGAYVDIPVGSIHYLDVVAAGTYTYKLQYKTPGNPGAVFSALNAKLVAYEL